MLETKSLGIFQGDIVIRTALIKGFREIRQNPKLLDYCFAWLPNDSLTAAKYGTKTVDYAKRWFLATEIPVRLDVSLDQVKLPCITISLTEAQEMYATLGDVNYDPGEDGPEENEATDLESVMHRESYNLGIYVQGEPEQLLFLYSIVVFILYRYKKTLLEARGFEISTMSGGKMTPVEAMDRENVFGRPISVTGYARHYWPSVQDKKIAELQGDIRVISDQATPLPVLDPGAGWLLEPDDRNRDAAGRLRVTYTALEVLTTSSGETITDENGNPITI